MKPKNFAWIAAAAAACALAYWLNSPAAHALGDCPAGTSWDGVSCTAPGGSETSHDPWRGPRGPRGEAGARGLAGPPGPAGPRGPRGKTGRVRSDFAAMAIAAASIPHPPRFRLSAGVGAGATGGTSAVALGVTVRLEDRIHVTATWMGTNDERALGMGFALGF